MSQRTGGRLRVPAPVPAEHVHRRTPHDVLLTDWWRTGPDEFGLTARWPAGHPLHRPRPTGEHDPLLLAETVRQAGLLLAHTEYDVPPDWHFLMAHLSVDLRAPVPGDQPADLELTWRAVDVVRQRDALSRMRYQVVARHGGALVGVGAARFSCIRPQVYRRLRGERCDARPEPLRLPGNQVLAGGPDRWRLLVDGAHPVFFDHPVDHVPGMLLVAAVRQAACRDRARLAGLSADFHRYVEFDQPCWITADRSGDRVVVAGRQGDRPVFDAVVTLR